MESKIIKLYEELFPKDMPLLDISKQLEAMDAHPDIEPLRKYHCNVLLYVISSGYTHYDNIKLFETDELVLDFVKNVKKLSDDRYYYWAVCYFYLGNHKKCIEYIKKDINMLQSSLDGLLITEGDIVELYIEPYKNAFDGFWEKVQNLIEPLCEKDGTHQLCKLMDEYYKCKTNDEAVDILTKYIQKYPDIICAKEYLGCTYYNLKMWNNAVAVFESIENPMIFANTTDVISFWLAWSYGKLKDYKQEEQHYRNCLKIHPTAPNALNNLGYSLYKQRRYLEAKEIFNQCLRENRDVDYAANNYVRTLVALGRNGEAHQFISSGKYKIIKALKDKVKSLDKSNARLKKRDYSYVDEETDDFAANENKIELSIKKQQFSNEKLLEDELTNRIESGVSVFGMKLKIYKRHGEYGRQYIIPCGRLDLLCEDLDGNLYVIELKKDSGYDDAYQQIVNYLEWFAASERFKDKNVYGIICLNAPTQDLVQKVHADSRIRLFEYMISYREL